MRLINPLGQNSLVHSHAVSSKPEEEDFKGFVTSMLLHLKAKIEKNEMEIEQFRRVTIDNASNNDIMKKIEEQSKEIVALKVTIQKFEATLSKKLYDQANAADYHQEKFEKVLNRKLDRLHRQGESVERKNVNLAGHLHLPDPRKDAQELRQNERRREIQERSNPRHPLKLHGHKRPRLEDWFNCSKQPDQAQSSRREDREPKKTVMARLFDDNVDLSNPPEE